MFRNGSPYSPFFTSGLLSGPAAYSHPPASTSTHELLLGQRRGSLPTDSKHVDEAASMAKASDESSAFYFTLQPKRDSMELRSFLSLDLAESQSLRTASLRRKFSDTNASTKLLPPVIKRSAEMDKPQPPSSPLRSRHSRESLRSLPSPKPAPSITLPDLPKQAPSSSSPSLPPRLPPITVNPTLRFSAVFVVSSTTSVNATSKLAPPPTPEATRSTHRRPPTRCTSSSVSTRTRGVNRTNALAHLEGRVSAKKPQPLRRRSRAPSNFMSLSDEESDAEEDLVLIAALEPEDIIIPFHPMPRKLSSSVSPRISRRKRERRISYKDMWVPESFIDFHEDNVSGALNWRSFIEITSVS